MNSSGQLVNTKSWKVIGDDRGISEMDSMTTLTGWAYLNHTMRNPCMVCMAQGQEERLANYAARGEDNPFHNGEESDLYVLPTRFV